MRNLKNQMSLYLLQMILVMDLPMFTELPQELIKTPNINKLAKEGVKFTNAYTTGSVCTPTRYALMTGQYSWRTKLKKGVVNMNDPALIDVNRKTLPKYMQSLGYKTAMVGKWHLGFKEEKV